MNCWDNLRTFYIPSYSQFAEEELLNALYMGWAVGITPPKPAGTEENIVQEKYRLSEETGVKWGQVWVSVVRLYPHFTNRDSTEDMAAAWVTGAPLTPATVRHVSAAPGSILVTQRQLLKQSPSLRSHLEGGRASLRKPECVHGPGGRATGGLCQPCRDALPGLTNLGIERKISSILEQTTGTGRGGGIYTQWNHRGKIVDRQNIDPEWIETERNMWWWDTDMSNPSVQWNDAPASPEPKSFSLLLSFLGGGVRFQITLFTTAAQTEGRQKRLILLQACKSSSTNRTSWVGVNRGKQPLEWLKYR